MTMLLPMPSCFLGYIMSKDPAFLFYYQDFLVGTDHMTNEEVGAYIRCLCHQAHKGAIAKLHLDKICKKQKIANSIYEKFVSDGNGNLKNKKLDEVLEQRQAYIKHQAASGKKGAAKRWGGDEF